MKLTDKQKKEFARLYKINISEAAKYLGVGVWTAARYATVLGCARKIKKVTSEMIDGMRAAYKDGKPLAEILKEFGVSGATFYAHVEKSRNKKRTE